MTEQPVDTAPTPMCGKCGKSPTEVSVQIDDDNWQDQCKPCATKAKGDVIPIAQEETV